jgi:uroporphyrinogen-III synthase
VNWRVALTTTADRAHVMGLSLRREGLKPVSLPCIDVMPAEPTVLESARRAVASCDFLVLTSTRVVDVLWPGGDMPPVPVAAVGAATAEAVTQAAGTVTFVGSGGGADLIAALADSVNGKDLVFPHGSGADPATIERLRAAGAHVAAPIVYETTPIAPGDAEVDAVVFASPTAVEGWHLSRTLDDLIVGAMGETTASALLDIGSSPHVMPEKPSFNRLASLVAIELTERSTV